VCVCWFVVFLVCVMFVSCVCGVVCCCCVVDGVGWLYGCVGMCVSVQEFCFCFLMYVEEVCFVFVIPMFVGVFDFVSDVCLFQLAVFLFALLFGNECHVGEPPTIVDELLWAGRWVAVRELECLLARHVPVQNEQNDDDSLREK
jgi:hypothetical protein